LNRGGNNREGEESTTAGSSGTPGWVFGLVAVGVIVVIVVVVLGIALMVRRHRNRQMETV
jgi:predicted metalloprotease